MMMVKYRVSLFDVAGMLLSTRFFDSVDDAGALLLSAAMVMGKARVDIWAGGRSIGVVDAAIAREGATAGVTYKAAIPAPGEKPDKPVTEMCGQGNALSARQAELAAAAAEQGALAKDVSAGLAMVLVETAAIMSESAARRARRLARARVAPDGFTAAWLYVAPAATGLQA